VIIRRVAPAFYAAACDIVWPAFLFERDREFESGFLQQRVMNEPAVALLGGMMRRPRSGATSPL
jgi:hypothetical protein